MKTAQLNGQEITVNEAIAHNAATKQRGSSTADINPIQCLLTLYSEK